MISINGLEYHHFYRPDGKEMSLLEKLRESYHGRWNDPRATAMSDRAGKAFFWFITLTELYLAIEYVVPLQFAEYSDWTRYCVKVFCWFIFIQTVVNWVCITHCDTSYHPNDDQLQANDSIRHNASSVIPKLEENGWNSVHRSTRDRDQFCKQLKDGATDLRKTHTVGDSALSWRWCKSCQHDQPPRCHHCVICRKCILKRDHHCYITGVCIGLNNQRHFIVMNFYIAIASLGGFYFIAICLAESFVPHADTSDYVLPVTIYRWAFTSSWIQTYQMLMVIHMYSLWWTGLGAVGFVIWHVIIICIGKTSHEVRTGVKLRCTATMAENFRSVFGALWLLNFIFPAHIAFKPMSNGVYWPELKAAVTEKGALHRVTT